MLCSHSAICERTSCYIRLCLIVWSLKLLTQSVSSFLPLLTVFTAAQKRGTGADARKCAERFVCCLAFQALNFTVFEHYMAIRLFQIVSGLKNRIKFCHWLVSSRWCGQFQVISMKYCLFWEAYFRALADQTRLKFFFFFFLKCFGSYCIHM